MASRKRKITACEVCGEGPFFPFSLVKCGHSFCEDCIYKFNGTCPVCRNSFKESIPNWNLAKEWNIDMIKSFKLEQDKKYLIIDFSKHTLHIGSVSGFKDKNAIMCMKLVDLKNLHDSKITIKNEDLLIIHIHNTFIAKNCNLEIPRKIDGDHYIYNDIVIIEYTGRENRLDLTLIKYPNKTIVIFKEISLREDLYKIYDYSIKTDLLKFT